MSSDTPNTPLDPGTITDLAKATKEVIPQTISQTDGALSALVGWFNNVILYPVKKANITFRYKLENFEADLREKMASIPPDKICEPNLMIAGPTLEALRYCYDEEKLRNMYINLLASSVNSDRVKNAHPSFVEVIRQMDPLDAQLFEMLAKRSEKYHRAINANVGLSGQRRNFLNAMPEWFWGWGVPNYDMFQNSASLIRLRRLGLVELMFDRTAGEADYKDLKQADALRSILQHYQSRNPNLELEITAIESIFYINEFGRFFAEICL